MTIREKMKNGMLYRDLGEGLEDERKRCQELLYDYNHTRESVANNSKNIENIKIIYKFKFYLIKKPLQNKIYLL